MAGARSAAQQAARLGVIEAGPPPTTMPVNRLPVGKLIRFVAVIEFVAPVMGLVNRTKYDYLRVTVPPHGQAPVGVHLAADADVLVVAERPGSSATRPTPTFTCAVVR
jgi:hypothetical protein